MDRKEQGGGDGPTSKPILVVTWSELLIFPLNNFEGPASVGHLLHGQAGRVFAAEEEGREAIERIVPALS